MRGGGRERGCLSKIQVGATESERHGTGKGKATGGQEGTNRHNWQEGYAVSTPREEANLRLRRVPRRGAHKKDEEEQHRCPETRKQEREAGKATLGGTGHWATWRCRLSRRSLLAPIFSFPVSSSLNYFRLPYFLFVVESFVVFVVSLCESSFVAHPLSRMRYSRHGIAAILFCLQLQLVFCHQRRWVSVRLLLLLRSPTLRVLTVQTWSVVYFYHHKETGNRDCPLSPLQSIPYHPFFLFPFILCLYFYLPVLHFSLPYSGNAYGVLRHPVAPKKRKFHFPLSRFPLISFILSYLISFFSSS